MLENLTEQITWWMGKPIKRRDGMPIRPPLPANVPTKDAAKLMTSNKMIVKGYSLLFFSLVL
ncbi:hypothetical protein P4597_08280 [Peribacillus simplex]|uniref:hypothetical protein n=1 Tax=Peribacillus simplex TaxID=1478 RepID=UPI002E1A8020|nr:hypothetical protein [Peribacillus simplex]